MPQTEQPTPPLGDQGLLTNQSGPQLVLFHEIDKSLPRPSTDGRDDMNLVELLLGIVRSRSTKSGNIIQTPWEKGERSYDVEISERSYRIEWEAVVREKGKPSRKQFYLAVDSSIGLPSPYVEDVLIALLKLSSEGKTLKSTVRTTRYKLLDMMQWPGKSKYYYERLENTLDHMASMTVRTNSLWNPLSQTYWKFTFNLLDSTGMDLDEENPNAEIVITWAPTALRLLEIGYGKPLDTQFYYSLDDPTSRRLYRWLDKQFRFRPQIEVDVLYLAHRVLGYGITWAYPSKVIQKLEPKLEKLKEEGFCTWEIAQATTDSGSKFVFNRITPYLSVVHPNVNNIKAALRARGLSPNETEELIQKYGPWSCLKQVEHYDYKLAQGAQIESPRSWIKSATAYKGGEGYKLPKPLLAILNDASSTTVTWCAQVYEALSEEDKSEINKQAMDSMSPHQRKKLEKQDPEATAAFNRARNHLIINHPIFPSVGIPQKG